MRPQKQVTCVTECEMGLLRTKGIKAEWIYFLYQAGKIFISFLNLQLDKLCVSQIDSLEYSGANRVKMSTMASVTLQRKKLVEGKAEAPPWSL